MQSRFDNKAECREERLLPELCSTLLQGVSCALSVSSSAYAGVNPPFMDINPMREAPSVTAARHASKFATNVEPVSFTFSGEGSLELCSCSTKAYPEATCTTHASIDGAAVFCV